MDSCLLVVYFERRQILESDRGKFMQRYKIRFFFEHGGDCFWGGDEASTDTYGYPIAPTDLPLPTELAEECSAMAEQWWLAAAGEDATFPTRAETVRLIERVREALGEGFEVIDEQTKTPEK